ncbi:hypothetical protein KIW84_022711 [Lathyrus oleraceus]|uniref:Uncharacterized protein n=1 Tax=Pisum sativum TaxID=3888 RepID=A0A9D4YDS3_PEA|nr:hypothetical protein KIW84_022711 [Pisum sativum]
MRLRSGKLAVSDVERPKRTRIRKMANQPNNPNNSDPNEAIPVSNPVPSTGGNVGSVPVSEAMASSTGSIPAVSISQNAPSSSVRAQQMPVGTPPPMGNTSRPFRDQAEVGEDHRRKEHQRMAYPKEEENLIEFIKRCQRMKTEVMLCPRSSAIFDRKAATNLEAVDKAKRKENWGTARYDPRRNKEQKRGFPPDQSWRHCRTCGVEREDAGG